ncbi:hypothetical protein ASPTUDRAFT_299476 [Aspergillus tubingensis CBS 134.48]|uniref:C2H2-type domain-containing protein n=1 Tax=Aspergillus tubingensis (strain CBS 134.48) TaxID=767770 RepID=A0A1L9NQ19_ASPTC|nr:hypothetical protein ASPTUDRAFT_299476 [Aspergillus tubingensis CBS 134.48]
MLRMARDEAQTWLEYDGDYYNNQMHNTLTMDSWDFLPNNEAIPSNQCGTYSAIPLNKSEFVENLWSLYEGSQPSGAQGLWPSPSIPLIESEYPGSPWSPSPQSLISSSRSPFNGFDDVKQSQDLSHLRYGQRASPESPPTIPAQRFQCRYCPRTYKKSNGRNRHETRKHGCDPKRPGRPKKTEKA